jgi:hypothetical protein
MLGTIPGCQLEGVGRGIGGQDVHPGQTPALAKQRGQGNRDGAAAGANVNHAHALRRLRRDIARRDVARRGADWRRGPDRSRLAGRRGPASHHQPSGEIHDQLGFRAGNQGAPVIVQRQAVKLLGAANVGNGLAPLAPGKGRLESDARSGIERSFGMGDDRRAVQPQGVAQQQLGIQAGQLRSRRAQPVDGVQEQLPDDSLSHLPAHPAPR